VREMRERGGGGGVLGRERRAPWLKLCVPPLPGLLYKVGEGSTLTPHQGSPKVAKGGAREAAKAWWRQAGQPPHKP
jgi:hypothetical protein